MKPEPGNMTFANQKKILQDLARIGKQQLRLNKVLEQSGVIKTRIKELIGKILKPLKQLEEAIEDPERNPLLAGYWHSGRTIWKRSSPVPNSWLKRGGYFSISRIWSD